MSKALEGENLGKKHQNYNILLKETITTKRHEELLPIDYSDDDINNFLKIDIASNNRNVIYILEVLKSEDILYASRAIKKSTWLYTDDQYANIINPEYLHTTLLPSVTTKAFNKLMFEIRLKLTNKKRIEEFYNYFKDKNADTAAKWLPLCSVPFIEQEVDTKCNDMKLEFLRVICKSSITILEICVKKKSYTRYLMEQNTQYMRNNLQRFLDMAESTKDRHEFPYLNSKHTKILMREQELVLKNFERYMDSIDLKTFANEMDPKKIKEFLKGLSNDKKFKRILRYDTVKHFINNMPKEERFAFVKEFFIDKNVKVDEESDVMPYARCRVAMKSAMMSDYQDDCSPTNFSHIYRWYIFSPFEVAFTELTKLIRAESSFTERNAMFIILLGCAKSNKQHIKTLLSYYHKKHINEPTKYKIHFINNVISKTKVHKYDDDTWKILNEIFYSLEVYNVNRNDPDVDIDSCVRTIILYNSLHNQTIPETIENKFTFNTFKNYQSKLTQEEKAKLFEYLYNNLKSKIENVTITSETQYSETFGNLERLFQLINDWNKTISDYPFALNTVKKLIELRKQNSWEFNLSALYTVNKSWRKYMFEESFDLLPSADVCFNALKHKPELLTRYTDEVQKDSISLAKVLKKIRTYWSQSLAEEWSSIYLTKIKEKKDSGYKSLVKGLCILLPYKRLLDIIKEYAPNENKVNWSEVDEFELTLRKLFAKNMHLSRPMMPPESILWYAKGDYLQFVLPSFNAIFDNLCQNKTQQHIPDLLRAPVSLQKHGISLMYHKDSYAKLTELWKVNPNKTIRATIFKQTHQLICAEKDQILLEEAWKTLSGFIDELTPDENKVIYTLLGKFNEVPRSLRARYCMKSYKFLKSLPAKTNSERIIKDVIESTVAIMEDLDLEFISEILTEDFDKKICKTNYEHKSVLSSFLLSCKTEEIQTKRYEVIFLGLLNRMFELWNEKDSDKLCMRKNLIDILEEISGNYVRYVCRKNMNSPVLLFEKILDKIESNLSIEENYYILRMWKLAVAFAKSVDTQVSLFLPIDIPESEYDSRWWVDDDGKFDHIFLETNKVYAKLVVEYLKADIQNLFPSVLLLFQEAYTRTMDSIRIELHLKYDILHKILELTTEFIPGHLFVLDKIPAHLGFENTSVKVKILTDICKKLKNHPSSEVKTHYYQKFLFAPDPDSYVTK